jgi:glucose 1-dehydrogenase
METNLAGKTALVTGASRGIGAAVAIDLARAGADVVVNYCRSPQPAAAVQAEIEKLGRKALVVKADVARCEEIRKMFDQIESQWGPVDILVNNAGIEERWPTRDCQESNYDAIMDTNLKGAFFCAQRGLEGMKAKGWGRLINISSVHELTPTGFCSVYGMSKGGMAVMMRELAREYARFGITVNNVCPGAIRTDINRGVLSDPAYEAKVNARIPVGYIGEPHDVAQLVTYLASDAARYITGASLFIDGGLSL